LKGIVFLGGLKHCRESKGVKVKEVIEERKVENMASRTFTAVLHKEGPLYVVQCPEIGTASQGQTLEEALANLKEATELYLEEFPLAKTSQPLVTTFEVDDTV
jgi:predicted RNase H-like HicB family nuclease